MIAKLKYIFQRFGFDSQVKKLQEEMQELNNAIESDNLNNFLEELVDVYILINQFKLNFENFDEIVDSKINRTISRIIKQQYNNEGKYVG